MTLAQSFADFAVLVVDGSAAAKSRDVVNEFQQESRLHYRHLPHGVSPTMTRNAGMYSPLFDEADYIKWLDDDDRFLHRDSLQHLVDAMTDKVLVYAPQVYINEHGELLQLKPLKAMSKSEILIQKSFPCSSMLLRKSALVEVGGFNWFSSAEDIELVLRMIARFGENSLVYLVTPQTIYRKRLDSVGAVNRANGEKSRASRNYRLLYSDSVWEYCYLTFRSYLYDLSQRWRYKFGVNKRSLRSYFLHN